MKNFYRAGILGVLSLSISVLSSAAHAQQVGPTQDEHDNAQKILSWTSVGTFGGGQIYGGFLVGKKADALRTRIGKARSKAAEGFYDVSRLVENDKKHIARLRSEIPSQSAEESIGKLVVRLDERKGALQKIQGREAKMGRLIAPVEKESSRMLGRAAALIVNGIATAAWSWVELMEMGVDSKDVSLASAKDYIPLPAYTFLGAKRTLHDAVTTPVKADSSAGAASSR